MKLFDKRTAQALLTALVFALALWFLYSAWRAILTFVFAIFFAYLLEAPVSSLQQWLKGSRGAAIAVVYLLLIAGLVVAFSIAGEQVMQQGARLMQQAPQWSAQISSGEIIQEVGERRGWSQGTINHITGYLQTHRSEIIAVTQNFVLRAFRSVQNMWWLLLVPMLAIFFLKDGHKMGQSLVNSVEDSRNRGIVAEMVAQMNLMLGHYLRAQITLAAIAMVVITFFLSVVFRVPYALALGPAAGALEFIPVVGPAVGGLMVLAVALLSGYGHIFWIFIFLLVWRGIQDYVSSPRIMGSTLELHPLTVLFGVLAGGEVAGVIGVFLSIPVLATLRILWHAWLLQRKQIAIGK
ncbi:MAG TPA: AI-2E family transporter [Candidatus Angelobacter sp.]|nr:AI-2E family transporter [Candidatus Angelobacter sp.]